MRITARWFPSISLLAAGLACLLVASTPAYFAQASEASEAEEEEVTYLRVTNLKPGSVLWVRSGPTVRSQRIGFFRYNDRYIRSYGCKTFRVTWCEVLYHGTRGWASKLYLTEDDERLVSL